MTHLRSAWASRIAGVDPSADMAFNDRLGHCYALAGKYVAKNPGAMLVHGSIAGFGNPRINHAWAIDVDNGVFEPTGGKHYAPDEFESIFHPEVTATYDEWEARVTMLREGHWGPWHGGRTAAVKTYYHGTGHLFRPGDVIRPGVDVDITHGTSPLWAFAAPNLAGARPHIRDWPDGPHVYEVQPVDPASVVEHALYGGQDYEYGTQVGWRVVREVPVPVGGWWPKSPYLSAKTAGIQVSPGSPLQYDRYRVNERISVIEGSGYAPQAATGQERMESAYKLWRAANPGAKRPKRFTTPESWVAAGYTYFTPENSAPGTVAFVDLQVQGDYVSIAYLATRPDHRGKGMARKLIKEVYDRHPKATIHWGKLMHAAMGHLYDEFRKTHPERTTGGHRDY